MILVGGVDNWWDVDRWGRVVLWADLVGGGVSYHGLMYHRLRSVWDEPRPAGAPARGWVDWGLVGAVWVGAVVEGVLREDLPWRVMAVVLAVGLAPTLLWRRSRPLPMVAIAFGACAGAAVVAGGDPQLSALAFLLILPYSLVRWGAGREILVGSAIVYGKVLLSLVLGHMSLGDTLGGMAILSASGALGAALRYRARARARELDQVKLLERERLARDLHDTVAHHVSAMAIRAQAGLATAAASPEAATDALRVIEGEASRTLAEMRSMVRVLRHNLPAERAPAPRVADLEQLGGRGRTGPPVEVEVVGDVDGLPPAVGTAIYRLAQESVTNARRHARHASAIRVRVVADDREVRLDVSDDGEPNALRQKGSPGFGLIGMIERADLLGGTCAAGPGPDRGWTVSAVLPRNGTAP
jgi:signal transduction histidine kinase